MDGSTSRWTGYHASWSSFLAGRPGVPARHIPSAQTAVRRELSEISAALDDLPTDSGVYGLIHSDFELDDLVWQEDHIGVLDFDDHARNWYDADIAFTLIDLFEGDFDGDHPAFREFLGGYQTRARPRRELAGQRTHLPQAGCSASLRSPGWTEPPAQADALLAVTDRNGTNVGNAHPFRCTTRMAILSTRTESPPPMFGPTKRPPRQKGDPRPPASWEVLTSRPSIACHRPCDRRRRYHLRAGRCGAGSSGGSITRQLGPSSSRSSGWNPPAQVD